MKIQNLISKETISKIFDLYHNSQNVITGTEVERFIAMGIHVEALPGVNNGTALIAKFTNEEMFFLWEEIQQHFPDKKLSYSEKFHYSFRMIRYGKNCFLDEHLDVECENTIVIQLNNPDEYTGGEFCLEGGKVVDLRAGDGILLKCNEILHSVKEIKSGVRYSIVVFCE